MDDKGRGISRRVFFQTTAAGGGLLSLGRCTSQTILATSTSQWTDTLSPIDREAASSPQTAFTGDSPSRAHQILWDLKGYFASHTAEVPTETANVVIVGGGMAGLTMAYELRDFAPVLLEMAPRFGGNSKGESWRGIDYAIGAAYFNPPAPASPLERLYLELGIPDLIRQSSGEDPVALGERIYQGFWDGDATPGEKASFLRWQRLSLQENRGERPLPRKFLFPTRALEKLGQEMGSPFLGGGEAKRVLKVVPKALARGLDYYCYSSFGGSADEVSAALGLNSLAGDLEGIWVAPGGNAAVAEKLFLAASKKIPRTNLRTGSLVVKVTANESTARVWYEDPSRKLRAIDAKAVVLSCPKFIVKSILEGIEPERARHIERLRYRSYVVVNVLIKGKAKQEFYDLFILPSDLNPRLLTPSSLGGGSGDRCGFGHLRQEKFERDCADAVSAVSPRWRTRRAAR